MPAPPVPANESDRLRALREMQMLDTEHEASFDRIAQMVARLFDMPIAAVSLVDEHREWFKAGYCLRQTEGDRAAAFCAYAILSPEVMVIEDATSDPRFADNPQVTQEGIRFYAGAPLTLRGGHNLGALCVKDFRPRTFDQRSRWLLEQFAAIVVDEMEHRLVAAEARAASLTKSAFLANMSHEIRTPMTAILGYTDMLLESALPASERINAVRTIRRNGEHLLSIINDILDLSKIEAARMTIEASPVSLVQLLADIDSVIQVRARDQGVRFEINFAGAVPEQVVTDALRLRQILINLCGNAIKFTPDGGSVNLAVAMGDGANGTSRIARFDVIDSGTGMNPALQARLFSPFTQADDTTSRRYGGTGLGLTISQRLARLLGGDVYVVRSAPGEGTHMRAMITLGLPAGVAMIADPRGAMLQTLSDAAAEPAVAKPQKGRILVAEDGPDNQRLVRHILESAGFEVSMVVNGEEAVEAAMAALGRGLSFDVILMDMQMPVMDGYSATRTLRLRGYQGQIVAFTAHAMAGDRDKCLNAGCDDFATKPIDRKKLLACLNRAVSRPPAGAMAGE